MVTARFSEACLASISLLLRISSSTLPQISMNATVAKTDTITSARGDICHSLEFDRNCINPRLFQRCKPVVRGNTCQNRYTIPGGRGCGHCGAPGTLTLFRIRESVADDGTLALDTNAEHHDGFIRIDAGDIALQPVVTNRALDRKGAGEFVGQIGFREIAAIEPRPLVIRGAIAEPGRADQPAAESMSDLHAVVARQRARDVR